MIFDLVKKTIIIKADMGKEELKKQIQAGVIRSPFSGKIRKLSLFGSRLSGQNRPDSDIDLLIEFEPSATIGFFELVKIQSEDKLL